MTQLTKAQQALLHKLDLLDGKEDHYIRVEVGTPDYNALEAMRASGLGRIVTLATVEQAYRLYSFHDPAVGEITVEYASDECRLLETLFRKPYQLAAPIRATGTTRTYSLRVLNPGMTLKVHPRSNDRRICEALRKPPFGMATLDANVPEVRYYRINDAGRGIAAAFNVD